MWALGKMPMSGTNEPTRAAAIQPSAMRGGMVQVEGSEKRFHCAAEDTLLSAALRAGVGLPYECCSGGCGSCKVDLVDGEVDTLRQDAPGLRPREWERGKRLACQSRARGNCVIKFRQDPAYVPSIRPRRLQARLMDRRPLTHDLFEFEFRTDVKAEFLPGQYALMHLPGVVGARAYSMSNVGNDEGRWDFQIKRVPGGTATGYLLDALDIGSSIVIEAPFSIAYLRPERTRDIVCIAGGSGLAPMLSIVRGAIARPDMEQCKIHLFYGGREPADIVAPTRFRLKLGSEGRLAYVPVISDGKSAAASSWAGARGFVHQAAADHLGASALTNEFYLAGPPPMVEAARRMLILEKKIPIEQVHYDRFF